MVLYMLASPVVNANSDNANFDVFIVNEGNVDNNNLVNSNGNFNSNEYGLRAVASKIFRVL